MEFGLEVIGEDFEHGLRCADCDRELLAGDRYSERLGDFIGEVPVVTLVCVGCALSPSRPTI